MRKNHLLVEKIWKSEIVWKLSKAASFSKKWGNCDINVLEQTKIPQFIGIPLRLFESLFVNMLVEMIAGYTELYGHKEKADTSLKNF